MTQQELINKATELYGYEPNIQELFAYELYLRNLKTNKADDKVENYNPNHDQSTGRFTSSGSGKSTYDILGIKYIETSELSKVLEGGKEKYIYDVKSNKYITVEDVTPTETFSNADSPYPSRESTKENIDKLSDEEKSSITGYTSEYGYGSYNEVNKYLRNPNSKKYSQETIDSANHIKSALNKSKLGTETYVYRGVSAESFENPETQKALLDANRMIKNGINKKSLKFLDTIANLKGATITDKAPTSTSPTGGGFFSNGEVKMTIKTKKSDKAMDITGLSRFGGSSITPAFLGVQQTESEVLYAPNTVFKITNVKLTSSGVHLLLETTESKSKNYTHLNYSPKQPRDSHGRWSSGGSALKHSRYTPNEYIDFVTKEYGDMAKFNKAEGAEIADYLDLGYQYTNADLVEGKKLDDYRKATVKTLDGAMKHKLKEDTILYRGIVVRDGVKSGEIIKYKGYSSTSINKEAAKKFLHETTDVNERFLMKIDAKKGQKGIFTYLGQQSNIDKTLASQEQEFLLPRKLDMKVNKINKRDDYTELEMSIL